MSRKPEMEMTLREACGLGRLYAWAAAAPIWDVDHRGPPPTYEYHWSNHPVVTRVDVESGTVAVDMLLGRR